MRTPMTDEQVAALLDALGTLLPHVRIPMVFLRPRDVDRWWEAWHTAWNAAGLPAPVRQTDGVDGRALVESREVAWKKYREAVEMARDLEAEVARLKAAVVSQKVSDE
jgi:hypothetical protein